MSRGTMTVQHTVWCGDCGDWEYVGHPAGSGRPVRDARRKGWRYTRAQGWVCPVHNSKATPDQVAEYKERNQIYDGTVYPM